jgi:phosphoglycerate dehydrogenase-like enzyme
MKVLVPGHVKQTVAAALQEIEASVEVLELDAREPPPRNEARILLRFFPNSHYPGQVFDAETLRRVVAVTPALEWIHNGMTGMDNVLYPELIQSDVVVTNGSGAHAEALAETALGMMLAWAKQFRGHFLYQQQRQWRHLPHTSLQGKTALILGLGNVGRAIAKRCHCFDMRVLGIKRRPSGPLPPGVDMVEGPAALHDLLPEADYLVIAAVLTDETRGMIGQAELRRLPPTAILINVARGAIVDHEALLQALQEKWIAGTSLDVFEEEPLPESSRLWSLPNVLITPHNAAWSSSVQEEALEIFYENFRRYVNDEPLVNVVDKEAGY